MVNFEHVNADWDIAHICNIATTHLWPNSHERTLHSHACMSALFIPSSNSRKHTTEKSFIEINEVVEDKLCMIQNRQFRLDKKFDNVLILYFDKSLYTGKSFVKIK